MRHALSGAVVLACAGLACGPGAFPAYPTGPVKLGEALAIAGVAAAAQIAQAAAEQRARNSAPVAMSSTGLSVSPGCDNDGQYGCVSVSASPSRADAPGPELDDNGARANTCSVTSTAYESSTRFRRSPATKPSMRSRAPGSDELAQDHAPNQHMLDHGRELVAASAEIQGSPDGAPPAALQDQIAQSLLRFTGEGPGGLHHDTMLRPEWRKLGVGIVNREGRTYLTVDFSAPRPDVAL